MIVERVRKELAACDRPENKIDYQRFFKEPLKEKYGLKTTIVRRITNLIFKEIKDRPRKEIFQFCRELLETGGGPERSIAFEWAGKLKNQYEKSDFRFFEEWLKKYVDNWAACDSLCIGVLGPAIARFPELVQKTQVWARSKNRWSRRASAVCLIVPVRSRILLEEIFRRADELLTDEDDMVQKGYGWMLKEAGNIFPDDVFKYVVKNKKGMPRTALRYAIEKFPAKKRQEAMKKD
jgi:3-methyladenine DNA glycosylase AlkD